MGGEQVIERGDGLAPGNTARGFQPLGMLVEHGSNNVDERLIAGEKAVPAGEQVAFQPAFTHVLAQNFHHPPIRRDVFIVCQDFRRRDPVCHFKHRLQTV